MSKFLKIALLSSLCFSVANASQDDRLKDALERLAQPKVSLESSYMSEADIKGHSGGFAVSKNKIEINNIYAGFSYTNRSFKWDHVADLPFGDGVSDPIKQMHSIKVDARLPYRINDNWFMLSSVNAKSSFEDNMDESYSFGASSFASYKIDEDHTIQMGAFINYHSVSTLVLPILSYSYRAAYRDGFKFVLGFPRTYVGYHLSREALVSFGMIYSQNVTKLSNSSVVRKGGFVETSDFLANIGLKYELTNSLELQADLLYGLEREFIMYNSNGNSKKSYDIESSIGAGLKVVYTF